MKKAIFLDRDGTINEDFGYVYKKEDFKFIQNVIGALKNLQQEYLLIIVTSQSGIDRNYYTEEDFNVLTKWMLDELKKEGVNITDIFYCPHIPEANCGCRKPAVGLLETAIKKYDIDLKNSYVIGDKTSDIKLAENFNIKGILVKTGCAGKDKRYEVNPIYEAKDLLDASNYILNNDKNN